IARMKIGSLMPSYPFGRAFSSGVMSTRAAPTLSAALADCEAREPANNPATASICSFMRAPLLEIRSKPQTYRARRRPGAGIQPRVTDDRRSTPIREFVADERQFVGTHAHTHCRVHDVVLVRVKPVRLQAISSAAIAHVTKAIQRRTDTGAV